MDGIVVEFKVNKAHDFAVVIDANERATACFGLQHVVPPVGHPLGEALFAARERAHAQPDSAPSAANCSLSNDL